jgi:hypothetical protein
MRKLFKLAIVVAAITGIAKLISSRKAGWQGLTEAQVRTKLHDTLGSRMPSEAFDQVADKVVAAMRSKGAIGETAAPVDDVAADEESADA